MAYKIDLEFKDYKDFKAFRQYVLKTPQYEMAQILGVNKVELNNFENDGKHISNKKRKVIEKKYRKYIDDFLK